MCGFCALLSGQSHWADRPLVASTTGDDADPLARRRLRAAQLALAARVARHYGCTLRDWMGERIVVESLRGGSELVNDLPAVWAAIEASARTRLDPLDPALLATLGRAVEP